MPDDRTKIRADVQTCRSGRATFSKFVQIGSDTRLHTPEIQGLLPPHYTTIYSVTLLTDQERAWRLRKMSFIRTCSGRNWRGGGSRTSKR